MQHRFYIRATGTKEDILRLHEDLDILGSTARALRGENQAMWQWFTEYQVCVTLFAGDELEVFLKRNWSKLSPLVTHAGRCELSVNIFSLQAHAGDRPDGYSLSTDTISLIAKLGAALDIDVIWHGPDEDP
jgi:hypothetical protein